MWLKRTARAQAYVEYGILVAVAVVAFLIGLNALMGGAATYMAQHAEPTPNATVLATLPNHVVQINMACFPPPPPVYTGTPFNCALTVTDITTLEPARLPTGTMAFTSSAAGTFNPSPCTLSGSGITSGCTFQYTPTNFGQQFITATYIPTSSHQSRSIPPAPSPGQLVATAIDQTQTQITCAPNVPVGEPSQCNVQVIDLYIDPNVPSLSRYGSLEGVDVDVATTGTGSFSLLGSLVNPSMPYNNHQCKTDNHLDRGNWAIATSLDPNNRPSCGNLFRSDTVLAEVGQKHTITAAFAGINGQYDRSDTRAAPAIVTILSQTPHPVTVAVRCNGPSPLQIDQGASTLCTATVTDTNPASTGNPSSIGNPTGITPTGTISWMATPGSGGAGSLSSNSCTLTELTPGAAYCQSTYTPTSVGTPPGPNYVGVHHLAVNYSADWIHPDLGDLQGSTDVNVKDQHPVQVSVTCTAGTTRSLPLLIQGAAADSTQCTVTVTDTSSIGAPMTPTGTVGWGLVANGGTGAFVPGNSCQLQAVNSSTAWCQPAVTYQPSARGTPDGPDQENTHTLVATYQADWLHPVINGASTNVFVANFHTVQVKLTCVPATTRPLPLHIAAAETTACTVNVTDPDQTPVTPTGTVQWSMVSVGAGGAGTFVPSASCQLQAVDSSTARCQPAVTYQPTVRGALDSTDLDNTHLITATYLGDGLHPADATPQKDTQPVYVQN